MFGSKNVCLGLIFYVRACVQTFKIFRFTLSVALLALTFCNTSKDNERVLGAWCLLGAVKQEAKKPGSDEAKKRRR
jgi:hypothetical protein